VHVEGFLDPMQLVEELLVLSALVIGVVKALGNFLLLLLQRQHVVEGAEGLFSHRPVFGQLLHVLLQVAHRDPLSCHSSAVRGHLLREDLKERCLAGSVWPHEPNAMRLWRDRPRQVVEEGLAPELDGYVFELDHRRFDCVRGKPGSRSRGCVRATGRRGGDCARFCPISHSRTNGAGNLRGTSPPA
jgi:hypothetical protein